MEHVVIGLIDERSDPAAIGWAIERATARDVRISLVTALDSTASNPVSQRDFLAATADRIRDAVPGTAVDVALADTRLLAALIEQSESADLMVVGFHPEPALRDGSVPSVPISLAARSQSPTVLVPDDRGPQDGPVVVGVETAEPSAAVTFAGREAVSAGRDLRIVHTWESWKALDARTEHKEHGEVLRATAERLHAEFPDIHLDVVLEEAVAHDGAIGNSRDARLVVLGTHGIGLESGVVLGAIHQEMMIRGRIPLCIVSL
jgi:nucleotide-binding universal stress UspA family protein